MVLLTHVAFATGVVVYRHAGATCSARFDFGVPLFFLLSGFLLYRPWVRAALDGRTTTRPAPLRASAARHASCRSTGVVVVVTLALLPEIQPVSRRRRGGSHLLALQIYQPGGPSRACTQTWSLCTEIAFYVAAARPRRLGATAADHRSRRRPGAGRWCCSGSSVVVSVAFTPVRRGGQSLPDRGQFWLPAYLDWFARRHGCSRSSRCGSRQRRTPRGSCAWRCRWRGTGHVPGARGRRSSSSPCTPLGGDVRLRRPPRLGDDGQALLYLRAAAAFFLLPASSAGPSGVVAALPRPVSAPGRADLLRHLPVAPDAPAAAAHAGAGDRAASPGAPGRSAPRCWSRPSPWSRRHLPPRGAAGAALGPPLLSRPPAGSGPATALGIPGSDPGRRTPVRAPAHERAEHGPPLRRP